MPKYFGARKLSLRLDEKRLLKLFWQEFFSVYFSECLTNGLFYVHNSAQLEWVTVTGKTVSFLPLSKDVYPALSYLSLTYAGETFLLPLSLFTLYTIPSPPDNPPHDPITS